MKALFGKVGETLFFVLIGVSQLFNLFITVLHALVLSFFKKRVIKREHLVHQMVLMGVDSLAIICLVGAAVGMVLALQAAYQLKQFGAVLYTGSLVSVSMARELGPLVAAIVISGRVGARIAAEIGTMKVQEEIDALSTMGLNPIRFLVVPRCVALMAMLPCLTVIADIMGMIGGFLIGTLGVGINPALYLAKNFDALVLKDVYSGLVKSVLFAVLTALVSCHQGLSVEGGAEGVGKATTQAVVISIVLIIVVDCLATAVFYYAVPS
ncbi:MAG TPA: ABC transporter permease [bacterium]|nr:ABC transporter permease [bacterium]